MSGTPNPLSILFRSELMCTSTTLLMLSKWMSQTCSMISGLGHRTIAVAHQELEQRVFLGLQVDRACRARRTLRRIGVHLEVGHAQHALARRAAPEQGTEPRRQLGERERLGHVVVGPGIEPGDALVERVLGGEDQHRQRRLPRPDVAEHLEPGPARQHQIEHDGVVVDGARLVAGVRAVVQDVDGVAFLLEAGLDEAGDLPVVLNHEDAHGAPLCAVRVSTASRAIDYPGPRVFNPSAQESDTDRAAADRLRQGGRRSLAGINLPFMVGSGAERQIQ